PERAYWTDYLAHDVGIVVVAGEEISFVRPSHGQRERASIGVMSAILRDVAGDDHDIDARWERLDDRREVAGRVGIAPPSVRCSEQMRVAQLGYEHNASVER